ncbi:MAG: ribonuclease H family protein [Flavobacteriaceae bacterium]|nr:ribonuclease H family protein [Flavobacteriaceae bacterium]
MAQKKPKFYTVWQGKHPGVFDNWDDCKAQIKDFKGAIYKSFDSFKEAKAAYKEDYKKHIGKSKVTKSKLTPQQLERIGKPNLNSICVDAAVSGNPGKMEYRGVVTETKKEIFRQGPFPEGTNNIGEFLAIVHALALVKKKKSSVIIYTDSRIAMGWVKKKSCNTKMKRTRKNEELFKLIERAVLWLKNNDYSTPVVKWETKAWGEIPADFGRK